MINSTNPSL